MTTEASTAATVEPHAWTDGGTKVRLLKRIDGKTRKTKNDFAWPNVGETAEAPDWNPANVCGGGLHFWPWAMGLGEGQYYDLVDDEWIVAEAEPSEIVGKIEGGLKCKARSVKIIYSGDFAGAMQLIREGQHRLITAMASAIPSKLNVPDEDDARIGSSGNDARIGSSGYDARIGSSGNGAQIGSSGYGAQIGSSGNGAQIGSSGNDARIGSSGNDARIGSSGYGAQIGSSGNDARIGSSGNDAQIGSSGYGAQIGSSGNDAQIGSSGNDARIKTKGDKAIVACANPRSLVRMKSGAFAIPFIREDGSPDFVVGRIGDNAKADVWYGVQNGKLIEVDM